MPADGEIYIAAAGDSATPAGQPITLTVTGLPHHSAAPRNIALGLAAAIVLAGVVALRRKDDDASQGADRKRLVARRDKLLQELARLEQDHRRGKIDDLRYAERREGLIDTLEQIYSALDSGDSGVAA
jgi:hypothetical protein